MKTIKTYICTVSLGMFEMQDSNNGNFVLKSDYDALVEENKELSIKNEKLLKAGDEMASVIINYRCNTKHGNALDKLGGFKSWIKWKRARIDKEEIDRMIKSIENEQ